MNNAECRNASAKALAFALFYGIGKIDADVVLSKSMIWQTTPIQRTPNKASVNEGLLVAVYCNEQTEPQPMAVGNPKLYIDTASGKVCL